MGQSCYWLMNSKAPVIAFCLLPLLSFCGTTLPVVAKRSCEKVQVGPGTEDFVLDLVSGYPRLIVSSHDRRNWESTGELYEVKLSDRTVTKMNRLGEPAGLQFRPQEVDIIKTNKGEVMLYAVIHDKERNGGYHAIVKYKVDKLNLVFQEIIEDPMITSPNGLLLFPDGTFYVANDREDRGSTMTFMFGLKRGTVFYYGPDKKYHNALAEKVAYANSMVSHNSRIYLSATMGNRIYSFQKDENGNLVDQKIFAEIKSPDNLMIDGEYLYTQSHLSSYKILKHLKSVENQAPSVALRIHLETGKVEYIYTDDGNYFGAASVSAKHKGKIYFGQIADASVLECDGAGL
jgi:arylesterase / paraoxonase